MQNALECMLILSTCADSVWHLYRMNADPEPISRFRSQKLHFYPTNDPESQILDVRITQNKRNAGETSVVQSDGWFWFWVYVPESRACRSSAGPLEDGAARYRDSLFRPAEPTEAEEEEERTSADRTDVSLKTRQTDVDIMLHRWCKVCCCCSRFLMFS